MCNPPFHRSAIEADKGSHRKWHNLNKDKPEKTKNNLRKGEQANLNFGGQKAELWCEGGEVTFIKTMFKESILYKSQVKWFTCLVSKKENLNTIKKHLKKSNIQNFKVVNMSQGHKISRFIAWSF
jgi:23S rRNA (adenine1618-N6)-methyltransferase